MLWLEYLVDLIFILTAIFIMSVIADIIDALQSGAWRNRVFGKSPQDARNHARYRLRLSERRGR